MADIYLVTGATGFLGSHVVQRLLAQGKRVRALVLPGDKTVASLPESVDIVPGDVTDMDSLRRFFAHTPDESLYVIHCASIITMAWEVEERVHRINVGGTRNIIDLCLEIRCAKARLCQPQCMPFLKNRTASRDQRGWTILDPAAGGGKLCQDQGRRYADGIG